MTIEEELFKETKVNIHKLLKYGFKKVENLYQYSKNIMNDTFRIDIEIDSNGMVKGKVYDLSFHDEYTNFRLKNTTSSFIKQVKDEFKNLLTDIRNSCFTKDTFKYAQTNRIAKQSKKVFGDEPEFEWEKFPGYATFRNKNSRKWYGIIMNLDQSKLGKKESIEVEIIDIKLKPDEIENLLEQDGFYPAYHMNKKIGLPLY